MGDRHRTCAEAHSVLRLTLSGGRQTQSSWETKDGLSMPRYRPRVPNPAATDKYLEQRLNSPELVPIISTPSR